MAVTPMNLWAGFSTGKISVYDMQSDPLNQVKEFQAYTSTAVRAFCFNERSVFQSAQHSIFSLSENGDFLEWDGYMADDYIGRITT